MGRLILRSTVTVGGGGGDSLTTNAYSTYATRVVDTATASDAAGGTTRTVTVLGESGSYQCYKTIAYAINDYLTAGGRRLIVKSGSYTLTADVPWPAATGLGESSRVVLMGDPADDMPVVTMGHYLFHPNMNGNRSWIVVRKMHMTGGTGHTGNEAEEGYIWTPSGGSTVLSNSVFEFLLTDDARPTGIDNAAFFVMSGSQDCTIRECKIGDIARSTSPTNHYSDNNLSCILGYDADRLTVHNCELYDARNALRAKRMSSNSNHGWTVRNNHAHDVQNFFNTEISSAGNPPHDGHLIYGNLAYSAASAGIAIDSQELDQLSAQSTNWSIYQNTFDFEQSVIVRAISGVDMHSNAFAGGDDYHVLTINPGSYNNTFTRCNYNAYFVQGVPAFILYNGGSTLNLNTVAAFKTADSVSGATEFTSDPEANGVNLATLAAAFTNVGASNYTPVAAGPLDGAGLSGADIGYDPSDCGPSW